MPKTIVHNLTNKVVVITGATSGNGEALVYKFLAAGAKVHAVGRNKEKLWKLQDLGVIAHRADFSSLSDIRTLVSALPDKIDMLFHMAGNAIIGNDEDRVLEFWISDFTGPMLFLNTIRPRMAGGSVVAINTSASVGMGKIPSMHQYQLCKMEMVNWWWSVRNDWATSGIHMMLISMGVVDTAIWDRTDGMGTAIKTWVKLFAPKPGECVDTVISDALGKELVSYPGLWAKLVPIVDGKPCPKPSHKFVATLVARMVT